MQPLMVLHTPVLPLPSHTLVTQAALSGSSYPSVVCAGHVHCKHVTILHTPYQHLLCIESGHFGYELKI